VLHAMAALLLMHSRPPHPHKLATSIHCDGHMAQHLTCLRRAWSAPRCSLLSPALHAYPSGRQRCHSGAALQVRWINLSAPMGNQSKMHIECFFRQPPPLSPPPPPPSTATATGTHNHFLLKVSPPPTLQLAATKPILVCITHPSREFGNVTHLAIISSSLQKLLHLQRWKETPQTQKDTCSSLDSPGVI
jgi:hypothetical protein